MASDRPTYLCVSMDYAEDRFFNQNKCLDERLDDLIHLIEVRLDKLHRGTGGGELVEHANPKAISLFPPAKIQSPYSERSFATFGEPYIRDFRNFGAPEASDSRQIQQLPGENDIDSLIRSKSWTKATCRQLNQTVLDYYSKLHVIKLIKQKNHLINSVANLNDEDVAMKLQLIDEQMEQVKAGSEPRIFVPEDKFDKQIDWCAISAKLSASQHDAQDCRLMWSNKLHWSINNKEWTKEEDCCLINAVSKHGKNDWDRVAMELNNGRLAWQCCARYNKEYASMLLTLDKDEISKIIEIVNLCRLGNYVPWAQVMHFIQYHGLNQVKYQWHKYCSEQQDPKPWTLREDYLLLRAIEAYGERDWSRISFALPGRTNKSCRERYTMRLKYQTRTVGSWKPAEDAKLMALVGELGTNWTMISELFPSRNCHQLRNRFELLSNNKDLNLRRGFIKHRKLHRTEGGEFVCHTAKRKKPQSDIEVDDRLRQIFKTYSSVNKNSKKLTYRSAQDEMIYQTTVEILCDKLLGREREHSLLERVITKAIDLQPGPLPPCAPTLRAYKAWSLQQGYLSQFMDPEEGARDDELEMDDEILQIILNIFLWPAVLARIKPPELDVSKYQVGSVIERDSKNLYKIRDIQRRITR